MGVLVENLQIPLSRFTRAQDEAAACAVLPSHRVGGGVGGSFGIPIETKYLPGKLALLLLGRQTL